jgi:hypothetical protein
MCLSEKKKEDNEVKKGGNKRDLFLWKCFDGRRWTTCVQVYESVPIEIKTPLRIGKGE